MGKVVNISNLQKECAVLLAHTVYLFRLFCFRFFKLLRIPYPQPWCNYLSHLYAHNIKIHQRILTLGGPLYRQAMNIEIHGKGYQ